MKRNRSRRTSSSLKTVSSDDPVRFNWPALLSELQNTIRQDFITSDCDLFMLALTCKSEFGTLQKLLKSCFTVEATNKIDLIGGLTMSCTLRQFDWIKNTFPFAIEDIFSLVVLNPNTEVYRHILPYAERGISNPRFNPNTGLKESYIFPWDHFFNAKNLMRAFLTNQLEVATDMLQRHITPHIKTPSQFILAMTTRCTVEGMELFLRNVPTPDFAELCVLSLVMKKSDPKFWKFFFDRILPASSSSSSPSPEDKDKLKLFHIKLSSYLPTIVKIAILDVNATKLKWINNTLRPIGEWAHLIPDLELPIFFRGKGNYGGYCSTLNISQGNVTVADTSLTFPNHLFHDEYTQKLIELFQFFKDNNILMSKVPTALFVPINRCGCSIIHKKRSDESGEYTSQSLNDLERLFEIVSPEQWKVIQATKILLPSLAPEEENRFNCLYRLRMIGCTNFLEAAPNSQKEED